MGAKSSKRVDIDNVDENHIIIAVIGQTGVGKSTFINRAVSQDVLEVGHSLKPNTRDIQHVEIQIPESEDSDVQRPVIFLEAPGFDSEREELEITKKLEKWLHKALTKKLQIFGILYLHRITDDRLSSPPIRHLTLLRTLCEKSIKGFPNRVVLVTTMWANMKDVETGERREQELQKYWNTLPSGSVVSELMRFQNSHESAAEIVHVLMKTN